MWKRILITDQTNIAKVSNINCDLIASVSPPGNRLTAFLDCERGELCREPGGRSKNCEGDQGERLFYGWRLAGESIGLERLPPRNWDLVGGRLN